MQNQDHRFQIQSKAFIKTYLSHVTCSVGVPAKQTPHNIGTCPLHSIPRGYFC